MQDAGLAGQANIGKQLVVFRERLSFVVLHCRQHLCALFHDRRVPCPAPEEMSHLPLIGALLETDARFDTRSGKIEAFDGRREQVGSLDVRSVTELVADDWAETFAVTETGVYSVTDRALVCADDKNVSAVVC